MERAGVTSMAGTAAERPGSWPGAALFGKAAIAKDDGKATLAHAGA
jgi:hypothetical protein